MPELTSDQERRLKRGAAIVLVATAFLWPAFRNRLPLLFPDALGYLRQGGGIILKLRGFDMPYWSYEIMRSEIYSASLRFMHRGANLWPIVALQSLATAWVLWLVVRSVRMPRPLRAYLWIMACLASLTGIGWYVSAPMPDILGPVAYLSILLLIMMPESLRRWETGALAALTLWCVTAHATHLLLAVGMCTVLAVLRLLRWPGMVDRGPQITLAVCLLAIAVGAQLLVHRRLYHEASLYGRPPAFLMARLIGDGPARLYLQQNCAASDWLICRYAANLPTTEEQFLWWPNSIQTRADLSEQKELRREELPLLAATLRTYPRQQILKSMDNFWRMLITMGPWDYWAYAAYTPGYLDRSVPGLSALYPGTLQARNELPQRVCRAIEGPVVLLSLALVVCLAPAVWRTRNYLIVGLGAVVLFILPANAFLSGVISCLDPRLQDRVTWMVVLLAGVMVYAVLSERRRTHLL